MGRWPQPIAPANAFRRRTFSWRCFMLVAGDPGFRTVILRDNLDPRGFRSGDAARRIVAVLGPVLAACPGDPSRLALVQGTGRCE